ncbi:hypothetical protein [Deinococcus arenicola]|uniref:DUF4177 domain-containing protein n=1 Tax=Deinococcus arenicola TaxID=2994950 RepID=A0ABU4DMJ3_9DEIO|nr:hypothetical protein [Deinococcus sp. ZS9-10]MDV6373662.1 hypothetical protein [Deinococcus sp. ZS9-10]
MTLLTLSVLVFVGMTVAEAVQPQPPAVPAQWEYMSLPISGQGGVTSASDQDIELDDAQLAALGLQGWELVSTITELETTHTNFGNSQYVTGLQPNIRADRAVLVFKRLLDPRRPALETGIEQQP